LCMISLRVSATNLVNKNEPEEIPKEFPSRLELAINYTRLKFTVYKFIDIIRKNKREN
jgi:hypothetical protein